MLKSKESQLEILSQNEIEPGKQKISVLIEPNLYRDMVDFMKDHKGSVDVEDQYGELMKGKSTDGDESASQEFMQLLENYEKMNLEEEEKQKEEAKKKMEKPKPAKKEQKEKIISCSTCKDAIFDTPKEYRDHVKSGWHLENLKRKMGVFFINSLIFYIVW